jgi:hypothetical protein
MTAIDVFSGAMMIFVVVALPCLVIYVVASLLMKITR